MSTTSRPAWGAWWAAAAATAVTSLVWSSAVVAAAVWIGRDTHFGPVLAVARALGAALLVIAQATSPMWFAFGILMIGAGTFAVDRVLRGNQEVIHG